ncbi:Golgi SNAP receptor complex member 2-like isoform X1 [Crassostrea angulata]|uniref:Golgi SNAP receptor complex member 2-like isoform X1 n=2 Tax=Magallana angulata TaxID=2784310 RepID=UPI0022B0A314|nr:Golgi SNAP receptor complex member 2-like isoform X1 [Crassostrea angulata]
MITNTVISSMESLYTNTNKLIQEVQGDLGKLAKNTDKDGIHLFENEIQAKIDIIVSNCERLTILVNKEQPTRRASAKLRVDQLKYDCQHIQAGLRQLQQKRYMLEKQEQDREELMSRTFAANDQDTAIQIDHAVQHHDRMAFSNREVDNMILSGHSVLENLKSQRLTLKGAQRKILDLANTLGLSNTVMRLIERRTYQDKFILYGGMIVTLIIMFLLWKYFS